MASAQQKKEISEVVQKALLKVCRNIVPFSDTLELQGLLLLETDGVEFCTVTFKNAKVTVGNSVERSCDDDVDPTEHFLESFLTVDSAQPRERTDHAKRKKSESWENVPFKLQKNSKGKFECSFCGKEFSFATNLTRHQRKYHGRPQLRTPKAKQPRRRKVGRNKIIEEDDDHEDRDEIPETASDELATSYNKDQSTNNNNNIIDLPSNNLLQKDVEEKQQNLFLDICDSNLYDKNTYHTTHSTTNTLQQSVSAMQVYPDMSSTNPQLNESFNPPSFSSSEYYLNVPDSSAQKSSSQKDVEYFQMLDLQVTHSSAMDNQGAEVPQIHTFQQLPNPAQQQVLQHQPTQQQSHLQKHNHYLEPTHDASVQQEKKTEKPSMEGKKCTKVNESSSKLVCPQCGRGFDFYRNLGRHVKVAHGLAITDMDVGLMEQKKSSEVSDKKPYKCSICNHSFTFKSNLYRHKTSFHGQKPKDGSTAAEKKMTPKKNKSSSSRDVAKPKKSLTCSICGNVFAFASGLARHVKKAHKPVTVDNHSNSSQVDDNRGSSASKENSPVVSRVVGALTTEVASCDVMARQEIPSLNNVEISWMKTNDPAPLHNLVIPTPINPSHQAPLCTPHPPPSLPILSLGNSTGSYKKLSTNTVPSHPHQHHVLSTTPQLPIVSHDVTPMVSHDATPMVSHDAMPVVSHDAATVSHHTSPSLAAVTPLMSQSAETPTQKNIGRTSTDGARGNSKNKEKKKKKKAKQRSPPSPPPAAPRPPAPPPTVAPPGESTPRRRHSDTSPRSHRCSLCHKVFTLRTNLTRHMRVIHSTGPDLG